MASKRLLKRDANNVFGDIIEAAYIHQETTPEDSAKTEAIVDEAIADFDEIIAEINKKDVENKKQHFKAVQKDLKVKAEKLVEKINAL